MLYSACMCIRAHVCLIRQIIICKIRNHTTHCNYLKGGKQFSRDRNVEITELCEILGFFIIIICIVFKLRAFKISNYN